MRYDNDDDDDDDNNDDDTTTTKRHDEDGMLRKIFFELVSYNMFETIIK